VAVEEEQTASAINIADRDEALEEAHLS